MAGLGYRLPGTRIEEVTQPKSVNVSSSQRTPCFIGLASPYIKVTYEAVVRSSTGLSDRLAYTSNGIYDIIQVGSQRGLNDFGEGVTADFILSNNKILWNSSKGIARGATYYVSYKYIRKYDADHLTDTTKNDYRYKEFTSYNDVLDDLGDDIPANTLVMIAKVALQYFNVPKIATVQIYADNYGNYAAALDLIKYRDVQTVVALTTNSQVRAAVTNHVTERSLPDNGRYRMAWFGAATGTVVGEESDPSSLRGIAANLRNELCVFVNATRAKYYYNDPDTKEQLSTVVDGSFIAAVLAAYRDSFITPTTTLMNKTVSGLELYDEDYDDYYSEYQLTICGGSSVFIVQSIAGVLSVVDDLTTDNTTVERNNINIITAKHYIAKDVIIQMNRTFRGRLIADPSTYTGTVQNYLTLMFNTYKNAGVIAQIGTLTATIDPLRHDTVNIYYSYYAVYTNKYINGTYALEV